MATKEGEGRRPGVGDGNAGPAESCEGRLCQRRAEGILWYTYDQFLPQCSVGATDYTQFVISDSNAKKRENLRVDTVGVDVI